VLDRNYLCSQSKPSPLLLRSAAARRLSVHSPIREWLRRQEEGTEGATADVLLDLLEGPFATRRADRTVAYTILGDIELNSAERVTAAKILSAALAVRRSPISILRKYVLSIRMSAFAAIATVLMVDLTGVLTYRSVMSYQLPIGHLMQFTVCAFGMFLMVLVPKDRGMNSAEQQAALESAVLLGGPECLSAVYRLSRQRLSALQPEAERALCMLLPTIGADWLGRLPGRVTSVLASLCGHQNQTLAFAALDAFERAGDCTAIPALTRLSARARFPERRKRIEVLVSVLQERVVIAHDPDTLLRAGSPDAMHKDLSSTLLKPADPASASEQLVIPASASE
jgi:hypothetical protein